MNRNEHNSSSNNNLSERWFRSHLSREVWVRPLRIHQILVTVPSALSFMHYFSKDACSV